MEEYIAKFWWRNPDTGFVEKREETFFGVKGKNAHKKVANMVCKKYHVKHEDIIYISYC